MSRKLAGLTLLWFSLGVGDDVQGAHDETRAVADDADLAVELDVVQALGLGRGLERVGCVLVLQRLVLRLAELGVLVEGHLAVEGDDVAARDLGQRVDLDEERVLGDEGLPQGHHDLGDLLGDLGRELRLGNDLAGLLDRDALVGVDRDLRELVGAGGRDLLDVHAAA